MANTTITPTIGAVALAGVAGSTANLGALSVSGVDPSGQLFTYSKMPTTTPGFSVPPIGQPNPGWRGFQSVLMQASGTFGSGGSVQLEGSNDGVNWVKLSPAALTSAGMTTTLGAEERPRYIRPNVTAGDGTTSLTVSIWVTY